MKVKGIHCGNTRRVVETALEDPRWVYDGVSRSGHGMLRWAPTGTVLYFALTPSDRNSWKNTARDIEKVSDVKVWRRGNTKPGRAAPCPTNMPTSRREQRERDRIAAATAARRQAAKDAADTEAADAHRREIESLMRPGRVVL